MGRPRGLTPDGPKIRSLRVDLGLTAAQLAPRVGLHPKTVMAIESTDQRVSDVTASRLATALGVKVEDITGDDVESEPEPKAMAS
jgi:DNA-binding XRE family transcriptional regulator